MADPAGPAGLADGGEPLRGDSDEVRPVMPPADAAAPFDPARSLPDLLRAGLPPALLSPRPGEPGAEVPLVVAA